MTLPPLPGRFVPRPALLERATDGLLAPTGTVALVGMGGAGKTTLARALAADERVHAAFPDGVLWLAVGPSPDLAALLDELAAACGDPEPVRTVAAGRDRLRRLLAGQRRLVVADNVWSSEHVRALDLGLPTVRLLVTARTAEAVPAGAAVCPVGPVGTGEAAWILAGHAGLAADGLPPAAAEVLRRCGGLPLALAAAGGIVAGGGSWSDAAHLLERVDLAAVGVGDYPYPDVLAALDASVRALPDPWRERFVELAVFAGRGAVPPEVAGLLWLGTGDLAEQETKELLGALVRRSLLSADPATGAFELHDLLLEYAAGEVGQDRLAALHEQLADGLLDRWGRLDAGLPGLRDRDPDGWLDRYGLAHLATHLVAAGREDLLHALLRLSWGSENAWSAAHRRAALPGSYLADLRLAWRLAGGPVLPVRYALTVAGAATAAANLPVELVVRLVEAGIWSPDRARADADARIDREQRARALAAVVTHLTAAEQHAAVEQAWTASRLVDPAVRVTALAPLASRLGAERWAALCAEALDEAAAAEPARAGYTLKRLAPHLPAPERARAARIGLDAARRIPERCLRPNAAPCSRPPSTRPSLSPTPRRGRH